MAFTTSAANQVLDKILRNVNFTNATSLYVSLHTSNPGDTGTGEVSGGSYARQLITFSASTGKATSNSAQIEFPSMPAGTVTYVGLWSAASGGVFWWGGTVSPSVVVVSGDYFRINAGGLSVSLT